MRLTPNNPALAQAVTIHPKARRQPTETTILKPVSSNHKMGKGSNIITKGKWAGMPMYQMSLEERATCPSSCKQWANCFANNMAFAHRIDHRHPQFLDILHAELNTLAAVYRHGFVVRPHVIGDFFSADYARFWSTQSLKFSNMRVFGFTHWPRGSEIGQIIEKWNENDNVWFRFSDQGGPMSANVEGEGFQCPEQTKQTHSCLTCGACWSTTKPVSFLRH